MNILPLLQQELEQEAATTRRFLKEVPMDRLDFKPHEKSMPLKQLSAHLAELAGWPALMINTPGMDFEATPYQPTEFDSTDSLLELFESGLAKSKEALSVSSEDLLNDTWTLSAGAHTIASWTKYEAIRHALAQTIHHRAQLGVYFRLMGLKVPGSYGPSADEQ